MSTLSIVEILQLPETVELDILIQQSLQFLSEVVGEFYSQSGGIFHFYCFCFYSLVGASALGAGDGDSSVRIAL